MISWQPSPLAPVFYGIRDYGLADGAPGPCRVFFPSLDGSPFSAEILTSAGRYPLVLFAHGMCAEPEHYKKWFLLPAALARAGYVVAVPELSDDPPWSADGDIARLEALSSWLRPSPPQVLSRVGAVARPIVNETVRRLHAFDFGLLRWLRWGWEHHSTLLPPPATGVAGHSYGALKGARLAAETSGISAYASLSGVWTEWPPSPPRPLDTLRIPTLLTWGTGITDVNADFHAGPPLAKPTHRVVFRDGEHWDYLGGTTSCDQGLRGPCTLTPALATDLVTMFFGRYLPPEGVTDLAIRIPHSLIPPPLQLSQEQQFFAGGWLNSFPQLGGGGHAGCSLTLDWNVPSDQGTIAIP